MCGVWVFGLPTFNPPNIKERHCVTYNTIILT